MGGAYRLCLSNSWSPNTRCLLKPFKIFHRACICLCSLYFFKAAVLRQCLLSQEGVPPSPCDIRELCRSTCAGGEVSVQQTAPFLLVCMGILTDSPAVPAELRAEYGRRTPALLPTFDFILRNGDFKIHKVSAFHQPCKTKDKC